MTKGNELFLSYFTMLFQLQRFIAPNEAEKWLLILSW